jgi:hypothetical protein
MQRVGKRIIVGVVLALSGVVAALAMIEACSRVYYYMWPQENPLFWEPHPQYGWRHTPGRRGIFADKQGEFRVPVRINSKGLRDIEHSYEKSPQTYRILILGDSYMEAVQVELEQIFARQLENFLRAQGFHHVEVINTGVASYGTDNEYLYLKHEGFKYKPDLVLLTFTTANDVRESYAPLNRRANLANVTKPVFALGPDGSLTMEPGPAIPPPLPWWRQTHVGQQLFFALGGRIRMPQRLLPDQPPADPSVPWVPVDMLVYANRYSPEVEEAWRLTKRLVLAIRDESRSLGARFAVVVVNGPWAHDDQWWNRMMARHPWGRNTWDRQRPNRIVRDFLAESDIPFVDLFDSFEAAKHNERLFFHFDPHWTPAGHRVAARATADFLIRSRLVTP